MGDVPSSPKDVPVCVGKAAGETWERGFHCLFGKSGISQPSNAGESGVSQIM